MRIGVTGHTDLGERTARLVAEAIRAYLSEPGGGGSGPGDGLVGVSCLAEGADSVFAQVVLDLGGALEVVLPSADYRAAKVAPRYAPLFDALLARAAAVRTMPYAVAGRDAYAAANEAMLGTVERLVAVWDGLPAADRGGTASAVAAARRRGIEVHVVWPEGAARAGRRARTEPAEGVRESR